MKAAIVMRYHRQVSALLLTLRALLSREALDGFCSAVSGLDWPFWARLWTPTSVVVEFMMTMDSTFGDTLQRLEDLD